MKVAIGKLLDEKRLLVQEQAQAREKELRRLELRVKALLERDEGGEAERASRELLLRSQEVLGYNSKMAFSAQLLVWRSLRA